VGSYGRLGYRSLTGERVSLADVELPNHVRFTQYVFRMRRLSIYRFGWILGRLTGSMEHRAG
jgi:hypothetical protein